MAYHDVQEQEVSLDLDTAVLTTNNLVTATIYGARGTWPLQYTTTDTKIGGRCHPKHVA